MLFWLVGIVRVRVYVLCLVLSLALLVVKLLSWDLLLHDASIIASAASHGMNNKFRCFFLCPIVRSFRSLRK